MTDTHTDAYADNGAAALDSFQSLFEQKAHRDHRTDDAFAGELIGDLLTDLMHYAEQRGLDYGRISRTAQEDFLSELLPEPTLTIGDPVRLTGAAAEEAAELGLPVQGSITGLVIPHRGDTEFYLRRLGDTRSQQFTAEQLEPAPPFPSVPTRDGIIDHPLRAEDFLVDAAVSTTLADTEQPYNVPDHEALLSALATWNGLDEQATKELLLAKIEHKLEEINGPRKSYAYTSTPPLEVNEGTRSPALLAAQAFPPLTEPLAPSTTPNGPPPSRPDSPRPSPSR